VLTAIRVHCDEDVTLLLEASDPDVSLRLLPLICDDLHRLVAVWLAHETPGQTLQPTALVHDACLRLLSEEQKAQHC
jgi:hypothetical protein